MAERIKRKPNVECVVCSQGVYRRPSELEKTKGRAFCSTRCYGLSCRRDIPCIVCGDLMLSGLNKKTCSRVCSNKNRSGVRYKTGRKRDKVYTVRSLKVRLLEKNGAFCERCGYNKVEILQVHHKNRKRDDNRISNLELLCPNCHCEEHYA